MGEIIEIIPLLDLEKFKEHRRLQTFYHKGCQCVVPGCNRIGTKLIRHQFKKGDIHVDLFTEDNHLMTVDHIIPKSKGGENHLNNYQPMCQEHNTLKGSKKQEDFIKQY